MSNFKLRLEEYVVIDRQRFGRV